MSAITSRNALGRRNVGENLATLRELTLLVERGVVNRLAALHGRKGAAFAASMPEIFQEMAQTHQILGLEI
jgi:hypothetical protein